MSLQLTALFVLCATADMGGQSSLSTDEALRLAFPEPASIERRTAFLSEEELVTASRLAGADVEVEQRVVSHYVATSGGERLGSAYFDVHRVRTMSEVLMIVLDARGAVRRVELVAFAEPPEYRPRERWLRQFEGAVGRDARALKQDVINITGATLTAGAARRAVQRVLALHEVISNQVGGR